MRERAARSRVGWYLSPDASCLRWTQLGVDTLAALPLVTQLCEIRYGTDGTTGIAGIDRGRSLAQMDYELCAAVGMQPQSAQQLVIAEPECAGRSMGGSGMRTEVEATVSVGSDS